MLSITLGAVSIHFDKAAVSGLRRCWEMFLIISTYLRIKVRKQYFHLLV